MKYEYRSIFGNYMVDFLEMKKTLGVNLHNYYFTFEQFDAFLVERNIKEYHITQELVTSWIATRVNDHKRTLYAKQSAITQFFRYLCQLGVECYIPRLPKRPPQSYTPYIFSHEQMIQIFEECDKIKMKRRNMSSILISVPVLVRFLYCTGCRIGEVINLKNEDVNLSENYIVLKNTKSKMHRLIPVTPSLQSVLEQYISYRNKMPIKGIDAPEHFFFVSCTGSKIHQTAFYTRFKKVLKKCGIPHFGRNQGPRVHDLRHTFAVHSLHQMTKSGMDIYCALPILSVFIGHKNVHDTEWYVRITREIFPDIIKKEEDVTAYVFPEFSL
jgi:site-specific recombinase XerD